MRRSGQARPLGQEEFRQQPRQKRSAVRAQAWPPAVDSTAWSRSDTSSTRLEETKGSRCLATALPPWST